ncbi:MAG: flavin monoamine oxidase family protein [Arenibacterium sp.]
MKTGIAIIGGGLSGLALARHLHRAGRDFHLFEARNRLGGRVKSFFHKCGYFDLGPSWFWPGQPRMADLVATFSLPVFEQYATGDILFESRAGDVRRNIGFSSMQGSLRIEGGMRALIDAVADDLPKDRLLLGKKLTSASLENGLEFGDGTNCKADNIVLAMPPRVAATLALSAAPSASQIEAMQRIPTWMAGHAKFIAIYDHAFWRDGGFSGDATSHHGPLVEIHDASPQGGAPGALFGFLGVPPAARAGREADVVAAAVAQLGRLFGPAAKAPQETVYQDWTTAPETATQADVQPLNHHPDYGLPSELRGLWQGRLHFCATETASEMGGYLEGALCAAEETAEQLLKARVS